MATGMLYTRHWETDGKNGAGCHSTDLETLVSYTWRRAGEGTEVTIKSVEVIIFGKGRNILPQMTFEEVRKMENHIYREELS